uniref:Uncharacterized protein n=1 Tax=Strombidium inclinatum TaxID=197538 RepID=A0A7S3IZP6_9SPIT|mmetsp:Transcript_6139/g.9861  ORF Transcript_6139/g.9861 Transcript_6139/m.9861 type:complete len:165 (+) Transcript_6139:419-913(+)
MYGFFRTPMLIMMPALVVLYMIDRDMFIFPDSGVTDEDGFTDTTYLTRDGIPYLLTRFYQLTTLLIFNGGQTLQEAIHGTPENADEFFGFNYQESRLNMRIMKEMFLVAVVFPFAMPLMNFWVGPWCIISFFGIVGFVLYEMIFMDVDFSQASLSIPEEDLPNY